MLTLPLQFGATEQEKLGSETPPVVLVGMLRGSYPPVWSLSCSDQLYAVQGVLVNGKAARKLL